MNAQSRIVLQRNQIVRFAKLMMRIGFILVIFPSILSSQIGSWISVGVVNVPGGSVYDIAEGGHNRICVATEANGIFASDDSGQSWHQSGLAGNSIQGITVDSFGSFYAAAWDGVYKSVDNAQAWTRLSGGLATGPFFCILCAGDSVILAGSISDGFFRSTDLGVSWTKVTDPNVSVSIVRLYRSPTGRIFADAFNENKVSYSDDQGISWKILSNPVWNICFISDSIAYGLSGGISRSDDGGITWSKLGANPWFANGDWARTLLATDSSALIVGTSKAIYVSSDNGQNWRITTDTTYQLMLQKVARIDNRLFAMTLGSGIFFSLDKGSSWIQSNFGLANARITSLLKNTHGELLAGTEGVGIYKSSDLGNTWLPSSFGLENAFIYDLAQTKEGTIFASHWRKGLFKSIDGGSSWSITLTHQFLTGIEVNDSGWIFVGNPDGFLFRSQNGGITWDTIGLAANPDEPYDLVFASHSVAFASAFQDIYRSTDQGNTWTSVYHDTINSLMATIVAKNDSVVFVGSQYIQGGGIIRTIDGGNSWSLLTQGLTDRRITALAIDSSGTIIAGTSSGRLFSSSDNGELWGPYDQGAIHGVGGAISALMVESTQNLFASSSNGALFRRTVSTPVSTKISPVVLDQFVLFNNYPNPFNPSTTLRYGLPSRSRVRLMVYNLLGQVVADLVNSEQPAGWNQVVWNANVASGMYFYRLEAVSESDLSKRFVDVKKMILLK